MIGTNLAHYRIIDKLGHGGMGEVYLAEDSKLKRRVALKVLSADVTADADLLARFQREAETVAALNHPNIVTLYSVEFADSVRFITMELVEGKTLDQVIPTGGFSLDKVFDVAIPFADALAAAHEKGIIHRDLKPANVMLSEEGRIKVLDFGLAKPLHDSDSEQEATQLLTQKGVVLGTVPYMAPEQVQGKPLDGRSDIFSMGVMLYEMATGSRPFRGETSADLISSILRDEPPSVTELKVDLPHHLGRIIRRCLEKDPQRRYQSALDIRNELEGLRKEVEAGVVGSESKERPATSSVPATPFGEIGEAESILKASRKLIEELGIDGEVDEALRSKLNPQAVIVAKAEGGWLKRAAAAAAVVALIVFGVKLVQNTKSGGDESERGDVVVDDGSGRPSIAVLFFDNLSGDPELDWLRNGLTDMLVTDLSQSPDLRVLATSRVYEILSNLKKLDERITSFEVIREVAQQAAADTVILGSFARLGETIRISIRVQEASTGEILQSDSVDATAQEEIFARIDDLSRNIRQSIELPSQPPVVADRNLADVSTQSVAAYRHYVEAERLHYESRDFEAIPFYEKAVEADPGFAMAWAKLSTAYGNTGRQGEANDYAEKAIEHLERLTEPERAYVEGRYYSGSLETTGQAIETYTTTLARYPHLTSLWNNLGVRYSSVWMYDEAIEAFEQGVAHGDVFPGTHHGLAGAHVAAGNLPLAHKALEEFLTTTPTSFSTYLTLAGLHLVEGRIRAAESAVAEANKINPGYFQTVFVQYAIDVTKGDWAAAQASIDQFAALSFPFARSAADGFKVNLLFYQGRFAEARPFIESAIDVWPGPSNSRGQVHVQVALGYYFYGDYEAALRHARSAREEDRGNNADFIAHGIEVLANQGLGRQRQADLLFEDLARRVDAVPGVAMKFWLREIRGRLAVARGDLASGLADLEAADAALPHFDNNGPRLWFALGEAYLASGQPEQAEKRFRQITELEGQRAFAATDYVRSHYWMGQILESRGDLVGARGYYRTFVDYWGDGDMDRDKIAQAEAFLARS